MSQGMSSGGGGGMSGGSGWSQGIKYATIGMGRQTEAYGAWYAGESETDYYQTLRELNALERDKELNLMTIEARATRKQADAAYQGVDYQKGINAVNADRYKKETDKAIGAMYSKMAKSGVRMDYGSPLDYINEAVTDRAKGLDIQNWSGRKAVHDMEAQAANLSDKSTIMLYQAKVEASKYSYQDKVFRNAKKEALKAAKWRQFSAYLGAISDVFGGSSPGQQGGGGASYDNGGSHSGGGASYNYQGSVDMNSGWNGEGMNSMSGSGS